MAIPIEQAKLQLIRMQDARIDHLFAQAHARHVLHEVDENQENFPKFDPALDDKVTFAAYAILAAGCSLAEQGDRSAGVEALESAATQLEHIHGPFSSESRTSGFHILIAALAFYAAGHYSRAFVAIRRIEGQTQAAQIICSFLRKDVESLIPRLNAVLLADTPEFEEQLALDEWVITIAIARSVAIALEFIFTGDANAHHQINHQLSNAVIVADNGNHPGWWWMIRLLRLMLNDLEKASPWCILPQYFHPNDNELLERYIQILAFGKRPVFELWTSQREALPKTLDLHNRGAVINLRTSAGKTRVAELAILQTLLTNPDSKVIYLAPFRSLALEIEHTLSDIFSLLGYEVSHLYGGSRVSTIDTKLASESSIIIATPEKTRALFRAVPEIFENIKLIIIDEGHLIGSSERYVRNELFIDHLRCLARSTGARILLLSAVLPNPQELAEWITGDPNALITSDWKPSAERFGILIWNGSKVRIDWQGKEKSFNPSFVENKPKDKNEAVAASAVRLSSIGSVMIFVGQARSVSTMAKSVLAVLGKNTAAHQWPVHEWNVFKTICQEELEPNAIEIQAAQVGVICHTAKLPNQVRMAMERLMRSASPKIIVATTTLAQGVNIGISTVIVASTMRGHNDHIDKRDFWNICGRAGRAFSDREGKIIYVIDATKASWQIKKEKKIAIEFLDKQNIDRVESGLLFCVNQLIKLANQSGINFESLLEMAANNDFSSLGDNNEEFDKICDRLDDELLAMHMDKAANPSDEEPIIWIEKVFRTSLAAIQARSGTTNSDDVLAFLCSRVESTLRRIPQASIRKIVVSSGIPLSIALRINMDIDFFKGVIDQYSESSHDLLSLCEVIKYFDSWFQRNASSIANNEMPQLDLLDLVREGWLEGIGLSNLLSKLSTPRLGKNELNAITNKVKLITSSYYGYRLPWVIHAVSQQMHSTGDGKRSETLDRIALLVELGVPNDVAAHFFLAGIHSRMAATELSNLQLISPRDAFSISTIRRIIKNKKIVQEWIPHITHNATAEWLNLMVTESDAQIVYRPSIHSFTFISPQPCDILHVRSLSDRIFLCSTDGTKRTAIKSTDQLPFNQMADDPRIAFIRSDDQWRQVIRDPHMENT